MSDNPLGSIGALRVRESFNPSGNNLVNKIKRYTADLIDLCNTEGSWSTSSEERRLWDLAMTYYEDAAMWAVKAATTEKPSGDQLTKILNPINPVEAPVKSSG